MGLLNDCPPATAYYHISKGLFITVPFTQYIMSRYQEKNIEGIIKGKKAQFEETELASDPDSVMTEMLESSDYYN